MSSYTKKAVHGAFIAFIISIFASFASYLTRLVLARNLSTAEYGLFYSAWTLIMFFLFFRDLGLPEALVKHIAEYRVTQKYYLIKTALTSVGVFQLAGSLLLSLVFFIAANPLAEYYFKDPAAAPILKIFLIYVLTSILFKLLKGFFQGHQLMFLYSSLEFAKNTGVLLLTLFFLFIGKTITAPAWAYALVCVFIFIIYLPFLLKTYPFFNHKITEFKQTSRSLLLFGLPSLATTVGGRIIGYLDTMFLTYFRPLSEVGIYNAVLPSALMILFLGRAVGSIIFPMSSELWARNDTKRLAEGVTVMHRYLFVFIAPLIASLSIFAEFLLSTFFGAEYAAGAAAFQIILIGVLFYIGAMMNHNIISGIGKPKTVTKIIFLAAVVNILFNLLLIPNWGNIGAALATTISYFVTLVLSVRKLSTFVGTMVPLQDWFKTLIPLTGFCVTIYFLKKTFSLNPWLELFVFSLLAGILYLLLAYLFGIINLKELQRYGRRIWKK